MLWRNDGPATDGSDSWVFTDMSTSANVDISLNGMGLGIGDYDNDGWFDLAFSNIGPNYLMRNLGPIGQFQDVAFAAGTQNSTTPSGDQSITWGTVFFDHDNDGWLDLFQVGGAIHDATHPQGVPNAFFRNNGDGSTFTDISAESGLDDSARGRSASIVDFDGDGYVDVFVGNYGEAPKLFHNDSVQLGNTNQWLTVTVEGTDSNRDGIGTRLRLTTPDGITQIREISSGPTHGGGDYRAAFFGLGEQTSGDLTILWPNGVTEIIGTVSSGSVLHFVEPIRSTDADITLSGAALDFGGVQETTTSTQTLTIYSVGGQTLTVTNLSTTNGQFSILGPAVPFDIPTGGSAEVEVEFAPTAVGVEEGDLLVTSNDPDDGVVVVALAGQGIEAAGDISLSGNAIEFGEVQANETSSNSLSITNVGAATLTVTDLSTTNALFSVVGPGVPFDVPPGGSQDVDVEFAPTIAGLEMGDLLITSNDPDDGVVSVALSGQGVEQAPLRINAGGPDYVDANGDLFAADKAYVAGDFGFVGGFSKTFSDPVSDTTDDPLYQSIRFAKDFGNQQTFSYLFDVADGVYDVTLFMQEVKPRTKVGARLFDVSAEGTLILDDFDLVAVTGGVNVAHMETFQVQVEDGQLNLDVDANALQATISAISVVWNGPVPAGTAAALSADVSSLNIPLVTTTTQNFAVSDPFVASITAETLRAATVNQLGHSSAPPLQMLSANQKVYMHL